MNFFEVIVSIFVAFTGVLFISIATTNIHTVTAIIQQDTDVTQAEWSVLGYLNSQTPLPQEMRAGGASYVLKDTMDSNETCPVEVVQIRSSARVDSIFLPNCTPGFFAD